MNERAPAATRIELLDEAGQPLLPPGLWVVYLLAPIAGAILFMPEAMSRSPQAVARALVSVLVPFGTLTASFSALYAWVMPAIVRRFAREWQRWVLHVAVVVAVSSVLALFIKAVAPFECATPRVFVAQSVVISASIVLPALVVQRLRVRAMAHERLATAERQASLRAQLAALTARTNPHFFFNAVNTVACLIPEDPALAERTLERLAELFRYAIDSDRVRAVPMAREVEMLRDYLAIQVARFGDQLETSVELDEAVAAVPVPPLLLQPLVENAVQHGVSARGRGRVHVAVRAEGGLAVVTVRDDGPGLGASKHRGTQTSVEGLRARIALLYAGRGSFALEDAPGGGCVARVALPLEFAAAL